jgi:hypothetical protein
MTEFELFELIQSGENVPLIARYILEHPELMQTLMTILLKDGENTSWRAAWITDKIHEAMPKIVIPYLPVLTKFVLITKDTGKKRHILKLISLHPIPDENMAELLDFCLNLFTNSEEPVAVRVHAMQVLFRIAEKEPEFSGELIDLIEHEIEFHGSAGISSRGKKLLKKLHKNKSGNNTFQRQNHGKHFN